MKTYLLIQCLLLLVHLTAPAQDLYHFVNGAPHPIYLSKSHVLIQFNQKHWNEDMVASSLVEQAIGLRPIRGIQGLAYLDFPEKLPTSDIERNLKRLRDNPNIKSAHPMMVTPEGVEVGGFLDQIIVRLKAETDFTAFQTTVRSQELTIQGMDPYDKQVIYLSGPPVLDNPIRVCNELDQLGLTEYAQPNSLRILNPAGNPSDPLFASQWGHTKMQLPEAWDISSGCSAIKIAIIDNGVQLNHPDLMNNIVGGFDAMGNGTNGGAVAGETPHGTKCAGIAGASSNGAGIAGAAYACKIIPVRAYASSGGEVSTDVFLATAINYAASVADVISMSWTIVSTSHPNIDQAITFAINNAASTGRSNKGCILVGAVGNDGADMTTLPTRLPNVLAVGTSIQNDTKWSGTNTPSGTYKMDLVAPGPDVTTITGSSYSNAQNDHRTSWSTPAVAGIAALILSVNPNLTQLQVKRAIVETCEKVGNYSYAVGNSGKYPDLSHHTQMGHGRANAFKAVEKAAGGPISGPAIVCSTANYILTSPIPGATVTWSSSNPGLTITNAGVATKQAGFNGEVTITATIAVQGACPAMLRKKVYAGIPTLLNGYYTTKGIQYGLVESDGTYPNTFCWGNNPTVGNVITAIAGSTSTSWTKMSSTPSALLWSSTGGNLNITFQAIGQQGTFKLIYSNACGSQNKLYGFKSVSCAAFIAYPNPATSTITFEFESTANIEDLPQEIQLLSEDSGELVRTIDVAELFYEKRFQEGNKVVMNVADLKRGTYYILSVPGKDSKFDEQTTRILLE